MAIYKLQGIVLLLRRSKSSLLLSSARRFQENRSSLLVDKLGYSYSSYSQRRLLTNTNIFMAKFDNVSPNVDGSSMPNGSSDSSSEGKQPSPSPFPKGPKPLFPVWMRWIVGSVISLLLSMWMPKWSTLLRIGGEAEVVMKEVEQVAEVVEKVATVAEKVAEDVADKLPDQNKLKEAAMVVEKISKETAKDAHIAEQIIHKVESVKHDLEDLETMAEPIINKIIHDKKP